MEYIGLNHYRRYFKFNKIFSRVVDYRKESAFYKLNKNRIKQLISAGKIVIAKPNIYSYSLAVDYSVCHLSDDLRALKNFVHDIYPDYDKTMYDFFYKNNKLHHYNMFISSWKFYDEYCTWLFQY